MLRYIIRNGEKVLQQIVYYDYHQGNKIYISWGEQQEWQDIPVVEEEDPNMGFVPSNWLHVPGEE